MKLQPDVFTDFHFAGNRLYQTAILGLSSNNQNFGLMNMNEYQCIWHNSARRRRSLQRVGLLEKKDIFLSRPFEHTDSCGCASTGYRRFVIETGHD